MGEIILFGIVVAALAAAILGIAWVGGTRGFVRTFGFRPTGILELRLSEEARVSARLRGLANSWNVAAQTRDSAARNPVSANEAEFGEVLAARAAEVRQLTAEARNARAELVWASSLARWFGYSMEEKEAHIPPPLR